MFRILIADSQKISFSADTTDLLGSAKIKGSRDNELFYEFSSL
ncbi:MAG: hypothetical protein R2822_24020 [Spirosomataceae bacterium]